MALLEVIVAVTILVIAGLSASVWMRQVILTTEHARLVANETRAASDYLDVIALWPREDLDRHLGERRQEAWVVRIERPKATLYTVAVLDSIAGRVFVQTVLYRAEILRASP